MIDTIKDFILREYGVLADKPFKDDDSEVFRVKHNKKWFAIIMTIPAVKLGIKQEGFVNIMNLKNTPSDVFMLRAIEGIFPAYHMNKENWLTILLDGKLPIEMIFELIDQSYQIINKK